MAKPSRENRSFGRKEKQLETQVKEDGVAFPRMVARIWGMIASLCYISTGGYLMLNSNSSKCTGAGIYMLIIGLVMLGLECPCFLIIMNSVKCCDVMDQKVPFWVKGVFYILIVIPSLVLCFSLKTMLTSLTVIILALLYFFLTCLQGNAHYQRLQGQVNSRLQQTRQTASMSYSTISHANATISAFKSSARNKHHTVTIKKATKAESKNKKYKKTKS